MKRARIANPVRQQVESASAAPPAGFAWLQFCFFLSGAAGLIYQVAWTKSLGLLFGYTAYSTATAIAVFMAGRAMGGRFIGQSHEGRQGPGRTGRGAGARDGLAGGGAVGGGAALWV